MAENLTIESLDAKLSHALDQMERQHRAICEMQRHITDMRSVCCNERGAALEDFNGVFEKMKRLEESQSLVAHEVIAMPAMSYMSSLFRVPGWESAS